jgi:hypothetical protein
MLDRPRFAPIADDAEPVATAPVEVKVAKAEPFDARELSRKAIANWPIVYPMLANWHGWAHEDIRRLGPDFKAYDPSRPRPEGWPRLSGLKGPSPYDANGNTGAWFCVGWESGGAHGDDVVDLIVFLSGGASRRVCAEWLGDLLDRLVVVKVA